MSDSLQLRHGLESFMQSWRPPENTKAEVQALVLDGLTHINLRGNAEDALFIESAEKVLRQSLPVEPNMVSSGEHRVYWLGPDEWLIVSASDDAPGLGGGLRSALENLHVSVNDISGGQVTLRLAGVNVGDILAKGCTLDFHPEVFRPGSCAQSGLGKANVLLGRVDPGTTFELIVRRSFAEYLALWLQKAASRRGIEFR